VYSEAKESNITSLSVIQARLNPDSRGTDDGSFKNIVEIARANNIGPWKWWSNYAGCTHNLFAHEIARVVLNIQCNASATERVNSSYKHVIGVARVRMNNYRAEKLVYAYVNSKCMKRVREHQRDLAFAEAKGTSIFGLPKLHFDKSHQEPNVYGYLAHDNLTSIGLDAFVTTGHVHELHDVMEGFGVPNHENGSTILQGNRPFKFLGFPNIQPL
jgi:hypothetical protein